jgi:hypothetical protein
LLEFFLIDSPVQTPIRLFASFDGPSVLSGIARHAGANDACQKKGTTRLPNPMDTPQCFDSLCAATHQKEEKQNGNWNTQRPEQYPSHFARRVPQYLHNYSPRS